MHVYYRFYELTPLKAANRLSSMGAKTGVHLKIKKRFTEHFADYFPHTALGDMENELFLEKFKFQDGEYEQKVFYFLLHEEKLRSQKRKVFLNHELRDGREPITAPVVKYKLRDPKEFTFTHALKKKIRVRLDANALFDKGNLVSFIKEIPQDLKPLIDYMEDPLKDPDWKDYPLPFAQDFIKGTPSDYLIHKPNSRFLPQTEKKVIMSSYMGSDLGRWHAYCELLEKGDLSEYHGILTPGLYQEQRLDFALDRMEKSLQDLYNDLSSGEWKLLCSI